MTAKMRSETECLAEAAEMDRKAEAVRRRLCPNLLSRHGRDLAMDRAAGQLAGRARVSTLLRYLTALAAMRK